MQRICAITGSTGYVGGCFKDTFATRGWEVLELVRQPTPGARQTAFRLGGEIHPGTLAGADVLVHCAYDFKCLTWEEISEVNVRGTEKLFAAARSAGVSKIVCISSISAFAGCRSLYGRAKLEIEKAALGYGSLVIRPGLVYGKNSGGMFGKLSRQVSSSSIVPMIGNGAQIQYLVHEQDLCAFVADWVGKEQAGCPPLLTAAHEQPWPFKELLSEIAREQKKKVHFVPLPWRLIWLGLKCAETCGLSFNFRSDSLVSLMHQNPTPDFSANARVGLVCRPFRS